MTGPEVKENQEPNQEPHDGDFWTPPPGIVEEKQEIEAPGDLAAALVYAVDLLHHELAVGTDFPGWELDDKEKEVWGSLWKQVLPFIAFKYLGIVLSLVIIAVFETICLFTIVSVSPFSSGRALNCLSSVSITIRRFVAGSNTCRK